MGPYVAIVEKYRATAQDSPFLKGQIAAQITKLVEQLCCTGRHTILGSISYERSSKI